MAFAPRNSKPKELRPLKGGPKKALGAPGAPIRGAFTELPGTGKKSKGSLAPRKQLVPGGRTLTNRIYVLIGQISHLTPEVQRSAVQELALLASASDASRLEILAAGGDKQLIKMAQRCEEEQLLRWSLNVLNSLAKDDWSRRRQQPALPRLLALLASSDLIAKEAAALAANLLESPSMLEAMQRLGGMTRLNDVAARHLDDPRLHSVNVASGASSLAAPAPLPPLAARPRPGSPLEQRPLKPLGDGGARAPQPTPLLPLAHPSCMPPPLRCTHTRGRASPTLPQQPRRWHAWLLRRRPSLPSVWSASS